MALSNKHRSWFRYQPVKWLIISVVVVLLVYLLWGRLSSDEAELFIPIDYSDTPTGLTITTPLLKGIEVHISGPKYLIKKVKFEKFRYTINLNEIVIGDNHIQIQKGHIGMPERITINSIHPPLLAMSVEKEIQKELPVMVAISGKPTTGFIVDDAVARPPSVVLRGAETILLPMEKAMTKPIDVGGLSASFKKEIVLDLPETVVADSSTATILSEIFIGEKIIIREFPDVPVVGLRATSGYNITPSTINIEVEGPLNSLERLHAENNVKAYVDLKSLEPGVYARPAVITLPLKTTLVGVSPEVFTVTIEE